MEKLRGKTDVKFKEKIKNNSAIACFEWVLKYYGLKVADNFQNKHSTKNTDFEIMSQSIMREYQKIVIEWKKFEKPSDKIEHIKKKIEESVPCIVQIYVGGGRCHAFPVIGYDDDSEKLIVISPNGEEMGLSYQFIIGNHKKEYPCGREAAWIEI